MTVVAGVLREIQVYPGFQACWIVAARVRTRNMTANVCLMMLRKDSAVGVMT